MHRASYYNVYINQRDAQSLVNSLYFFIKWLYMFRTTISPSSGAIFNNLYSAIGTCQYVWLLCGYSHTTDRRIVLAYTKCDVQLIKRLLLMMDWYSPKHVEHILKIKSNQKNSVHLVGLYTYCKMMHGAYSVKHILAYILCILFKWIIWRMWKMKVSILYAKFRLKVLIRKNVWRRLVNEIESS